MPGRIKSKLTFANVVSVVALFVALGGGAYALTIAPKDSVVSRSIKDGQVKQADISKTLTVAGAQTAVHAQHAATAGSATSATSATNADHASTADTANDAFSTFHDGLLDVPNSIGAVTNPIADLSIPHAGSYVISATLTVTSGGNTGEAFCVLSAGGDTDRKNVSTPVASTMGGATMALQVVHTFSDGALVTLSCSDGGFLSPESVEYTKITAVQVNNLANGGF
jgi:hypothetical protein